MKLREVIVALMGDAKLYLRQIDRATYSKPIRLLAGASLGEHTRHFVEYYQCLLDQFPEGKINYDKRKRQKSLEQDPYLAIQAIEQILNAIPLVVDEVPLLIESNYGVNSDLVVEEQTSLRRELLYNIEHTIHHLSIIKIGLDIESIGIQLPAHFGLTPSTLRYQNAIKSQPQPMGQ